MKKECNPSYLDSFSIVLFPKLILSILTITQFSIINCLETISKDRNLENTPLKPSPYALNHPNTLISTTLSYEDYNENNQQVDIFTTVKSINLKKFDELTSNLPTTSFLANEKDYRIHTLTDSQKFEEYHSKNIINDDSQLFILKGIKTNQSNILNSIDQCLDDGKWLVNQIINVKIQQPFIVKTLKMRILKDGIKKPIECSTICCQLNNCHEISLIDQFCVTITCNHSICPFKSIDFYDSNSISSDLRGSNVVWQLNTVYNYFDLNHLIQKSRSKSLTIFSKSEKILPLSNSKQSNSLQIFPALNEHVLSTISHKQCLSTFRSPCYGFLNKPGSRNQLEQSSVNRFLINTSSLGSFNEQFQYYFKEMDLIFNDYDHCSYLIKKLLCIMVFPFCMNRVNDSLKTGYLLKEVCQEDCVHIKDEKCSMHIQKMRKIRSLKKLAPDCTLLPSKISPNLVENSCFSIIDKFKLTMKEPLNNDYDMMISTEGKPKFRNITMKNSIDSINYASKFELDKPLDGWIEADSNYWLPLDSITFRAKSNEIVEYLWKIDGDNQLSFKKNKESSFEIFKLKPGNYTLKLKLISKQNPNKFIDLDKQFQIFPPFFNVKVDAGPDLFLVESDFAYLDGNKSIESLSNEAISHLTYQWEHTSGPQGSLIDKPDQLFTKISSLKKGHHVFKLSVSTGFNLFSDTVSVIVDDKNISIPNANAGSDQTVYTSSLNLASVILNASQSSDPMGKKLQYKWIKDHNNPPIPEYSKVDYDQAIVSLVGLKPGSYKFKLVVTNSDLMESVDHTKVIVKKDENEYNFVDLLLNKPLLNFTENDKDLLFRRISLLLDLPENAIKFVDISNDSISSCRATIFVEDSQNNVIDGLYIIKALRHLLKSGSLSSSFMLSDIELNVCRSKCNNHGKCDRITKTCICSFPWSQNPLKIYFIGKEETNCELNQFFFAAMILGVMITIALFTFFLYKKKKKKRYSLKDDNKPSKANKIKRKPFKLPHEISDFEDETIVFEKPLSPVKNNVKTSTENKNIKNNDNYNKSFQNNQISCDETKIRWGERTTQHADRLFQTPTKHSNPVLSSIYTTSCSATSATSNLSKNVPIAMSKNMKLDLEHHMKTPCDIQSNSHRNLFPN